ncbi:MAG: class B sortase [Defluviitaleaceae bacterium]|nr:class B sortase [Defluviitaleaceae bacterium]
MRKIFHLFFVLALLSASYAAFQIITIQLSYRQADQEHLTVRNVAFAQVEADAHVDSSEIDFEGLRLINAAIVGWIQMPGTNIDHPIVQGEDNVRYLTTTFKGESNPSGAIFMDARNQSDFSDHQTIIYGHHMLNGTMFSDLIRFQDQAFFDQYPVFTIHTPEGVRHYEIFSAYLAWAYSDTYLDAFATGDRFAEYLHYITGLSMIQTGIVPLPTDQIVSLSTCEYVFEDARMIVHGRLIQ